jgi:hypothetical protein
MFERRDYGMPPGGWGRLSAVLECYARRFQAFGLIGRSLPS